MAVIYTSMNGIKEIVPVENYMRVRKSYILSIDYIHAVKGKRLFMKRDGLVIPIGASFKKETLKKLKIKK